MLDKKLKPLLNASVIGFSIVFSILIGLAIGIWLDKLFNTKPYLTIVFLIFGVIAGFKNMIYFIKKANELKNDDF
jgi:ATP synthase protein I